ncbi:MAG: uncharacterized protein K0S11_969 [Gammaproteobacteria bacterium]|jgi:murein DD-endopeptidase MepM/ murein hydrolase activator NlpD|nr:uncharacterized protein [Gammaproteobacteria bacterium]
MKQLNFFIIIFFSLLGSIAFANNHLPKAEAVPGGVVALPLASKFKRPSSVIFQGRQIMVLNASKQDYAIVGIPLSTKPGNYQINYTDQAGQTLKQTFTVRAKAYPTQYLTIANKRKVNPNPADLQRIAQEQVIIDKLKNTWTQAMQPNLQFNWPLKGRISSAFGLQRFYNGEPRSPHAGLDIAAPAGTPIKAPAAGRVLGTGNFFYSGNAVYLDHGQGLITMYGHMSKIKVRPGQLVKTGTLLGLVGQTGRATGPHLHWGVMLNKALVDPALFISQYRHDSVLAAARE